MPAAVSVPNRTAIEIEMTAETWAFGPVQGAPSSAP